MKITRKRIQDSQMFVVDHGDKLTHVPEIDYRSFSIKKALTAVLKDIGSKDSTIYVLYRIHQRRGVHFISTFGIAGFKDDGVIS